ncbi:MULTISPECIES: hypothetical protein [unclassified Nonomuraea]|uniref:hypothetical protein n=1 Tax=unclassified Nonomuraea TaxID=2593643 RepID=UPI0033D74C4D
MADAAGEEAIARAAIEREMHVLVQQVQAQDAEHVEEEARQRAVSPARARARARAERAARD